MNQRGQMETMLEVLLIGGLAMAVAATGDTTYNFGMDLNGEDVNHGYILAGTVDANRVMANYYMARNWIDANFMHDLNIYGTVNIDTSDNVTTSLYVTNSGPHAAFALPGGEAAYLADVFGNDVTIGGAYAIQTTGDIYVNTANGIWTNTLVSASTAERLDMSNGGYWDLIDGTSLQIREGSSLNLGNTLSEGIISYNGADLNIMPNAGAGVGVGGSTYMDNHLNVEGDLTTGGSGTFVGLNIVGGGDTNMETVGLTENLYVDEEIYAEEIILGDEGGYALGDNARINIVDSHPGMRMQIQRAGGGGLTANIFDLYSSTTTETPVEMGKMGIVGTVASPGGEIYMDVNAVGINFDGLTYTPTATLAVKKDFVPYALRTQDHYLQLGDKEYGLNSYRTIGFGYRNLNYQPAYMGYQTTSTGGSTKGRLIFGTRNVTTDTEPPVRMIIEDDGDINFQAGDITTTGSGTFADLNIRDTNRTVLMDWYTASCGGASTWALYGRNCDANTDEYNIWTTYIPDNAKAGTALSFNFTGWATLQQPSSFVPTVKFRWTTNRICPGDTNTLANPAYQFHDEDLLLGEARRTNHFFSFPIVFNSAYTASTRPGCYISVIMYRDANDPSDDAHGDFYVSLNAELEYESNTT